MAKYPQENDMHTPIVRRQRSLHDEAEKWFTAGPATTFHVLLHGRARAGGHRYVWIEARQPAGAHALFFFRHEDGRWCVVPPEARQPVATVAFIT
jgi:hypothetical protein